MSISPERHGPAQVSITTEDNVLAARTPAQKPKPAAIAQASAPDLGDLRATREARGWTQRELAKRIGCSAASIAHIEAGRMAISDRMRAKIQKAGIVLMSPNGNGSRPNR
jgi:ribosome-binding protein aMBF1 (putative translation factor)